jgi:hypothetical protein
MVYWHASFRGSRAADVDRRFVLHIFLITESPITPLSGQWISFDRPESKETCKKTLQAWRLPQRKQRLSSGEQDLTYL